MIMGKEFKDSEKIESVLLRIPMLRMATITVGLPAGSLAFCIIHGLLFAHENINDTDCKVANVVPSISAVTGATPGRYVWRICIGLHSMPRFLVAIVYYNYYMSLINKIPVEKHTLYRRLMRINYWLVTIENACLVAVAYISNKENYPLHEKIFVVFMVTSCFFMLTNNILFSWSRGGVWNDIDRKSYKEKKLCFILILLATACLLFFFVQHRLFCRPYAFSFFSISEFVIAYTSMGYHYSARYEFRGIEWMTALPVAPTNNVNNHVKSN